MPTTTRLLLCGIMLLAWGGIVYVADNRPQPRLRGWVYGYLCAILVLALLTLLLGDP